MRRRSLVVLAVALSLALAVPLGAQAAGGSTSFVNFELAGSPPHAVGTVCPQSNLANCTNNAAEPQIRAGADGTFYATSENGLGGGTDAWKSTAANALHYLELPSPNQTSATQDTGFAPGGGDTDIAVATATNSSGHYNVYVSSLSLANVDVSTTTTEI